jgi:hypothetical protein
LELKEMKQQRFIMRFVTVSKWGHWCRNHAFRVLRVELWECLFLLNLIFWVHFGMKECFQN